MAKLALTLAFVLIVAGGCVGIGLKGSLGEVSGRKGVELQNMSTANLCAVYGTWYAQWDKPLTEFRRELQRREAFTQAEWHLVLGHKVKIGSSKNVALCSFGKPDLTNRTTNTYGVREQWVYGHGSYDNWYLYLTDGKVSAMQN